MRLTLTLERFVPLPPLGIGAVDVAVREAAVLEAEAVGTAVLGRLDMEPPGSALGGVGGLTVARESCKIYF